MKMPKGKICRGCKEFKLYEDFAYRGTSKSLRRSDFCIECELADAKKTQTCLRCGQEKCVLDFRRRRSSRNGFTRVCMDCQAKLKAETLNAPEGSRPARDKLISVRDLERALAAKERKENQKLEQERLEEYERNRPVYCHRCGIEKPHYKFINLFPVGSKAQKYRHLCDECQKVDHERPKGMTIEAWERELRNRKAKEKEERMVRILKKAKELGVSYGAVVSQEYREAANG